MQLFVELLHSESNVSCHVSTQTLGLHCFVLYSGAVHRFYESRRRLFNDEQPGRVEAANATKKKSKQTTLRKQVIILLLIKYHIHNYLGLFKLIILNLDIDDIAYCFN